MHMHHPPFDNENEQFVKDVCMYVCMYVWLYNTISWHSGAETKVGCFV